MAFARRGRALKVNLREERLNRGLTIRDLAAAAGTSVAAAQRAETGQAVSPTNAKAIADFLGFKVTEIWPVQPVDAAKAAN